MLSRSTDRGETWEPRQSISNPLGGQFHQGVNLGTGPNGEVYACFIGYNSFPGDESFIGFTRSYDGGKAIWPHNEEGLENLARYIIRASFSQERMTYIAANYSSDGVSKVNYQSKDGTSTKTFDAPVSSTGQALDWLAQLVTHIPNKGEQMVRYGVYPPLAELLL